MKIDRLSFKVPPMPGGKEFHVLELTRQQASRGNEIRVLFSHGDGSLFPDGVTTIRTSGRSRGALGQSIFGLDCARHVRKARADLVHVHGDWTDLLGLTLGLRGRPSCPLVLTVHGRLSDQYRGLAARVYRNVDAFIALGSGVAQDLAAHGVPASRIAVMSSGIPVDRLRRLGSGVSVQQGRVVAVGSLVPVKAFDLLITAFRGISLEAQLLIVGEGPERQRLEDLARGDPRIRFAGALSRDRVYEEVAASQIFVMSSTRLRSIGEGVPTALLEAMALGKDCLVSADASPEPVVSDLGSLSLFASGSTSELRDLLASHLKDPAVSLDIGKRAQAAVGHLGWEEVAKRVDIVYQSVIEGGGHIE